MSELEWDDRLELNRAQLATRPVLDRDLLTFIARRWAQEFGLDPALICALCEVESGWETRAIRQEVGYTYLYGLAAGETGVIACIQGAAGEQLHTLLKEIQSTIATEVVMQKTSWGLMQIMGAVARERGFGGWLTELCDPAVNLEWGCRHLRWMELNADSYGIELCADVLTVPTRLCGLPQSLAAAWNGGAARFVNGKYANQSYVDRVVKAMEGYQ